MGFGRVKANARSASVICDREFTRAHFPEAGQLRPWVFYLLTVAGCAVLGMVLFLYTA